MVPDIYSGDRLCLKCVRFSIDSIDYVLEVSCLEFQVSRMSGTVSRISYPLSPGWVLGGHMVPDAYYGGILCPGGVMYHISGL